MSHMPGLSPAPPTTRPDSAQPDRWCAPYGQQFSWEPFDDAWFLFNPLSGTTHVLNALAFDIITTLTHSPATIGELLSLLDLAEENSPNPPGFDKLLRELDHLGLIAPAAP